MTPTTLKQGYDPVNIGASDKLTAECQTCQVASHEILDHFVDVNKMVDIGSG